MLPLATDWATISSLATAGGTLVLAIATFASVRSAHRSARIAEIALQEQRQPVLAPSRMDDPAQKLMFYEGRWVRADGGRGVVERDGDRIYLAISLRNVGAGIGVCQGWFVSPTLRTTGRAPTHAPEADFRLQTRDLYIPAGDVGMWQGALRDPNDETFIGVAEAIDSGEPISIELLYSDQVGEQRTISRFGLIPVGEGDWLASVHRHWFLDRPGPRSERDALTAAEAILHEIHGSDSPAVRK
ncbi:MAG TPA: hypothetical protein VGF70_11565 [Solirubrobacteraceae bacterium]|jgi:hypothetical protein